MDKVFMIIFIVGGLISLFLDTITPQAKKTVYYKGRYYKVEKTNFSDIFAIILLASCIIAGIISIILKK